MVCHHPTGGHRPSCSSHNVEPLAVSIFPPVMFHDFRQRDCPCERACRVIHCRLCLMKVRVGRPPRGVITLRVMWARTRGGKSHFSTFALSVLTVQDGHGQVRCALRWSLGIRCWRWIQSHGALFHFPTPVLRPWSHEVPKALPQRDTNTTWLPPRRRPQCAALCSFCLTCGRSKRVSERRARVRRLLSRGRVLGGVRGGAVGVGRRRRGALGPRDGARRRARLRVRPDGPGLPPHRLLQPGGRHGAAGAARQGDRGGVRFARLFSVLCRRRRDARAVLPAALGSAPRPSAVHHLVLHQPAGTLFYGVTQGSVITLSVHTKKGSLNHTAPRRASSACAPCRTRLSVTR